MIAATCLSIAITRVLVTSDYGHCEVQFDVSESGDWWLTHERDGVWKWKRTLAAVVSFVCGESLSRTVIGPSRMTLLDATLVPGHYQVTSHGFAYPTCRNECLNYTLDRAHSFLQYYKCIILKVCLR